MNLTIQSLQMLSITLSGLQTSIKKALGRLVPTVDQGHECNNLGFDFICYSGDIWVLHNALEDAVSKIRDGSNK